MAYAASHTSSLHGSPPEIHSCQGGTLSCRTVHRRHLLTCLVMCATKSVSAMGMVQRNWPWRCAVRYGPVRCGAVQCNGLGEGKRLKGDEASRIWAPSDHGVHHVVPSAIGPIHQSPTLVHHCIPTPATFVRSHKTQKDQHSAHLNRAKQSEKQRHQSGASSQLQPETY